MLNKSFLNNHKIRGLRNNNPGNLVKTAIKWLGKIKSTDTRFEQFESLHYGILAQLKDLIHDIKKGKNTVTKLISEYAPSFENDTKAYVNSVCQTLGITPNQKIVRVNSAFLIALARAIYKVELGKSHELITDDDIQLAINKLANLSSKELEIDLKKKT